MPAVGLEPDYWVAMSDARAAPGAMAGASGPYASTLPARLGDLVLDLPADLATDAEDAAAALAGFDKHARHRLGGDSPALAPMSECLLRTEAAVSSQLANLPADARQVALAALGPSTSGHALAVAAHARTLRTALRLADDLDEQTVLALHLELLGSRPGWEGRAGRYRDQLAWVGGSSVTPRGAAYVGPKSPLVPSAMRDLTAFVQREDLPVVAHAAIAHAQLETIRPFASGNARTARALVHAMLRAKGVVRATTAPLSAGLVVGAAGHADALVAYRAGDARPVVERFAAAARFAAHSGADLVDRLTDQLDAGHQQLTAAPRRPEAETWRVLPLLLAQPVVTVRSVQDHLGLSPATAQRALGQLAEVGVVTGRTGLTRDRVWQHDGILAVLDAWAANLRRG